MGRGEVKVIGFRAVVGGSSWKMTGLCLGLTQ